MSMHKAQMENISKAKAVSSKLNISLTPKLTSMYFHFSQQNQKAFFERAQKLGNFIQRKLSMNLPSFFMVFWNSPMFLFGFLLVASCSFPWFSCSSLANEWLINQSKRRWPENRLVPDGWRRSDWLASYSEFPRQKPSDILPIISQKATWWLHDPPRVQRIVIPLI